MLLINSAEILEIQDRAINGPYKTTGDRFAYSPSAWDNVAALALSLYNDSVTDLWDATDITSGWANNGGTIPTNTIGHYTMNCAFYYLIKQDAGYGAKAKASILAQVRNTNPVFENYYSLARSSALNMFHFAGVAIRFLLAFEYCKDLFSASEITEVETWMGRAYTMFRYQFEYYPNSNFPNRLSRDYSVLGNYAASGQTYGGYDDTNAASWTHVDGAANKHNRIYRVHTDYNNQDNLQALFCGLWAIYKNDLTEIDRVKIFFEEFIKFAVYEDGTIGEYNRNNVSFPQLGTSWYSVITLECYIYFAEALRRIGDSSMYQFSSNLYLWYRALEGDTVVQWHTGTTKNLALLLNTLMSNITQSIVRYYNTVTDANKLDVLGGTDYRYTPELIFAIANKYFNEDNYKNTYLLNNAVYTYNYASGPQYITNGKWQNNTGIFPVSLLNETEGIGEVNLSGGIRSMIAVL